MKDCIEWDKRLNEHGYGIIYHDSKQWYVHRLEWTNNFGEIPKGKCVCHTCDNRKCYNINHLFLGSHLENMQDMAKKGVLLKRAARGEKQALSKFTEKQIREIRKIYDKEKYSIHKMAKIFSIAFSTMYCILTRKTWAHVK
jgi:hypothetical protein